MQAEIRLRFILDFPDMEDINDITDLVNDTPVDILSVRAREESSIDIDVNIA